MKMGGADWFSMPSADFVPKTSPRIYFPIGQWEDACPCKFACHVARREIAQKTKLGDSNLFWFYPINSRECESVSDFSVVSKLNFFLQLKRCVVSKIPRFRSRTVKNLTNAFFELPYTTCKVLRLGKITGNSLPSYLSRNSPTKQPACSPIPCQK